MSTAVTIVIPSFNRASLLKETLDSVLTQTYSNWECLVVDDGSKDETIQLLEEYSNMDARVQLFKRPEHRTKGPSSCRNLGLEKARGEFLIFLDSDDLLAPNCLEERIKFAEVYPEFDLWIFKTKNFLDHVHDENRVFNMLLPEHSDSEYLGLFYQGYYPFCITGPLWRTDKLKEIEGFDERLKVFEDPDLHIRAFRYPLRSRTDITGGPDSFYRIDPEKRNRAKTKAGTFKLDKGAYHFSKKHLKKNRDGMKRFCQNYYQNHVLEYSSFWRKWKFYLLYATYGLFSTRQWLLLPLMIFYKVLKIDSVGGLGYYRLNRFVYSTSKLK